MPNSLCIGGTKKYMKFLAFLVSILYPIIFATIAGVSCLDTITRFIIYYCGVMGIKVLVGGLDLVHMLAILAGSVFGWKVFDYSFDGLVAKLEKEGKFL